VTSATHSSAGSCSAGGELAEPGAAAAVANCFEIERPKYATPVQPFKPYDAWRLGPPIPGCEDERIENAHAIAEFRTPSDPAVGAPRQTPLLPQCRLFPKEDHPAAVRSAPARPPAMACQAERVPIEPRCVNPIWYSSPPICSVVRNHRATMWYSWRGP